MEKADAYYSNDYDWETIKAQFESQIAIDVKKEPPKKPKKGDPPPESEEINAWDVFYQHNQDNFFKDRKYLTIAFAELETICKADLEKPVCLLECGCGTGNTIYPLLKMLPPNIRIYAFDISPTAVDLVKSYPEYQSTGRVTAAAFDIITADISSKMTLPPLDFITMIFFLSAIPVKSMESVVNKLVAHMKPGGIIVFRDYGLYDMAMIRNHQKGSKVDENCYLKGDGTYATYFSKESLTGLFEKCGCERLESEYATVKLENKKRELTMYRVFVSAKFRKLEPKIDKDKMDDKSKDIPVN